jgi:glycosyltransferase involved in cell wall biosynthesis
MKVSVIIPAYNEEKYIGNTLNAVLAQDYPNVEVIVVDNASTDKTAEIIQAYKGVKYVYESRKGLLWAREAGRKQATGDIIVNTDADCTPPTNWISQGVACFTTEKIVAVTGPVSFNDAGPVFQKMTMAFQRFIYPVFSYTFQFFRIGGVLIGGNNFIRAKVLQEVGGYNTSIIFYGEDTDTAKRLVKKGKILFTKAVITETSSRRFVKEGTWETLSKYIFMFLWVTLVRNPQRKISFHAKNLFSSIIK